MTDKDMFATYRKTAPAADLEFFQAHAPYLSGEIKIALRDLQGATLARAEFYRRLTTVQNAWRRMRNDQDREAGRAFDDRYNASTASILRTEVAA